MASAVYILCALTSAICAWLLFRGYRRSRVRLLFWSALGFMGLVLNNVLLIVDRLILPDVEMTLLRMMPAVVGVAVLLYGLVMENP
jgi:hypothetical protein